MHYRNGREAKNGDRIVTLSYEGGKVLAIGILYDAVAGMTWPRFLFAAGLDKRPAGK